MENGITGLTNVLEFRNQQARLNKSGIEKGIQQPKEKENLRTFIAKSKQNRDYLLLFIVSITLQFVIFKFLYPRPDFISDSYSYINTNLYNMDVNLWPIGYSKYLAFVHLISPSDTFLIFTQFAFLEVSFLYFFFSLIRLQKLPRNYTNILFAFLFFNPLFIYLSNCVLSDAIFCAISVLLFTEYLWMLKRPKSYHVYLSAALIGILFTIRYTAIYYPIVGAAAFLLSSQPLKIKILGIILPWILIIPFILHTQQKTKQITGTAEFSVFGGWQLANNALYMYEHLDVDSTLLPKGTLELNRAAIKYFHSVLPEDRQLEPLPGTFFMKMPNAILKPYLLQRYTVTDPPSQFLGWGKVSPIYNAFGSYLIKHYPFDFAKYYLWLNIKNYFIPHLEKFGNYNLGMDSLSEPAKTWFQLKDNSVDYEASQEFQNHLFYFYPVAFMMLNLYFLGMFLIILFSGKLKKLDPHFRMYLLLTILFLGINFAFSVFATPVVLRYQIFPMILLVGFSLYLTDAMDRLKKIENN